MFVNSVRACLVVFLGSVVGLSSLRGQEGPARPPELKALERFAGTWDTQATVKVAEWSPKEVKTTGSIQCAWVLDGRFIQGKGTDSLKQEFLVHWTYDTNKKAYRSWFFSSGGAVVEWGGKWDPDSRSFTLKQELGNGITDTLTARFVDANTVQFTSEAKGQDGKIYFAMEVKWTRRK